MRQTHAEREREKSKVREVEGKGTGIEQRPSHSQSSTRGRFPWKVFFILNHLQLLNFSLDLPPGC